MLNKQTIQYQDGDQMLTGYYVFDETKAYPRPGILVAHDWSGRNDFACEKADKLAEMGYVGFALDLYGQGKQGRTKEEKTALMQPLMQDRALLQRRMKEALTTLKQIKQVDAKRTAAIGFCFGGLCVLDLARSGADMDGVVSFHGLLNAPETLANLAIKSKILALHGFDDPMVPPEQVLSFENEMTKAKADWQLHVYGNTVHGFTNPLANDPGFGTVYNPHTTERAWLAMKDFFEELFPL